MTVDPLAQAQEAVREAEQRLHEARVERDRLIREAVASGATINGIGKRIGITAQAVYAITKRR